MDFRRAKLSKAAGSSHVRCPTAASNVYLCPRITSTSKGRLPDRCPANKCDWHRRAETRPPTVASGPSAEKRPLGHCSAVDPCESSRSSAHIWRTKRDHFGPTPKVYLYKPLRVNRNLPQSRPLLTKSSRSPDAYISPGKALKRLYWYGLPARGPRRAIRRPSLSQHP